MENNCFNVQQIEFRKVFAALCLKCDFDFLSLNGEHKFIYKHKECATEIVLIINKIAHHIEIRNEKKLALKTCSIFRMKPYLEICEK